MLPVAKSRSVASPATVVPAGPSLPANTSDELTGLSTSASRKMHHGDGPGCLADLKTIQTKAPNLGRALLAVKAQCMMLSGDCAGGKKLLRDYYVREMAFAPERAQKTADSIGSMRCRGDQLSDKEKLRRAQWELIDGGYTTRRTDCGKNVALVRQLSERVELEETDKGARKALFHSGAACFANAGNCAEAWRVWQENYPATSLNKLSAPARLQVIAKSFRSTVTACKDLAEVSSAAEQKIQIAGKQKRRPTKRTRSPSSQPSKKKDSAMVQPW